MSSPLQRLHHITQKSSRTIIGLMSGTSLDGLDVALCNVTGNGCNTQVQLLQFATEPYTDPFKQAIKQVFAQSTVSLQQLCILNRYVAQYHAAIVNRLLQQWQVAASEVDVIASHGQTIFHAPARLHQLPQYGDSTLQIGDGDQLAMDTGIITIADFRQKHIAAGGEGAPLALYGDYFLCSHPTENRLLLNIGGIANISYLPAANNPHQSVVCGDTGPGNTLIDAYVQQYFAPLTYDADAQLSKQGRVNQTLLQQLLQHPYLNAPFPKTTGQEMFNLAWLQTQIQHVQHPITHYDVLATLCAFTAAAIAHQIQLLNIPSPVYIYGSGGGMHNPLICEWLQRYLPQATLNTSAALGILPDAKEAILFAVLANETLSNNSYTNLPPALQHVKMGKICLPG